MFATTTCSSRTLSSRTLSHHPQSSAVVLPVQACDGVRRDRLRTNRCAGLRIRATSESFLIHGLHHLQHSLATDRASEPGRDGNRVMVAGSADGLSARSRRQHGCTHTIRVGLEVLMKQIRQLGGGLVDIPPDRSTCFAASEISLGTLGHSVTTCNPNQGSC